MNRHVKKINSIFFYQKGYTNNVISSINNIEDTSFVAIYNPETKGIMNATIELFGNEHSLELYEIFNKKQIINIAKKYPQIFGNDIHNISEKELALKLKLFIDGINNNEEKIQKLHQFLVGLGNLGKLHVNINLEKTIDLEDWTSSEQRVQVEDKYLNIFFASFKDENDRPSGIMVVVQDITEHVRLDNMRKEFVADVSHELKTPITSIMGYADTLLEGEYDKETQDKFLNVIASEARRMAKLVTDLLILSRYDNNRANKEKSEFDLGELVKKCQEKLQLEINKKNHQVESFVTANVPPVKADKDGIERVILNIMTNSIKYTPDGGNIKIYVGFVYNDAYIKVIDNGIGIPEEDLNRIFERFYRVDKARTREMGGTGLGLSIAKEILDQNKGSIDIKSEKGKGTEVVIRIPTK